MSKMSNMPKTPNVPKLPKMRKMLNMLNMLNMPKLFKLSKLVFSVTVLVMLGLSVSGCMSSNSPSDASLTVSAAISLKAPLEEIASAYQGEHPDTKITFNFASSGTLQQQLEQGLPVDVFISAGRSQMDRLVNKELIDTESVVDLLSNELVLVSSPASAKLIQTFDDLRKPQVKYIAIGQPELVPAGSYAQETLQTLGLWEELQPKFVYAKDVSQVVTYVESGNAEAGLVYRTDALRESNLRIVAEAKTSTHQPIVYPAAILKDTSNPESAQDWLTYLQGKRALKIFQAYGFKGGEIHG